MKRLFAFMFICILHLITSAISSNELDSIEIKEDKLSKSSYNFVISRPLSYYKATFIIQTENNNISKTVNHGHLILYGLLFKPSFDIEISGEILTVYGLIPSKIEGHLLSREELSQETQNIMEAQSQFCNLSQKLTSEKVTSEDYILLMKKFVEQNENYINKATYGESSVSVKFKNNTSIVVCLEPPIIPQSTPNLQKKTQRLQKQLQDACDCLENNQVLINVPYLYFKCADDSIIDRIDRIVSSVDLDYSKPVSEYKEALHSLIEILHTLGIHRALGYEANTAAIILANWNRDPAEVLREAKERAEKEPGE